jgi:lysophospholipase L1-like esterase
MEIGSRYVDCQEKIKEANIVINNISKVKGCIFIDLYSAYQVNDSMPKKYSRDGLHLYPEAYSIWARVISPYLLE